MDGQLRRTGELLRLILNSPWAAGGVSPEQLVHDFRHQCGEELAWRALGFSCLAALLHSLPPSVCRLEHTARGMLVFRGGSIGRGRGAPQDEGRSRRGQEARAPGRRPREKSMAWVPPRNTTQRPRNDHARNENQRNGHPSVGPRNSGGDPRAGSRHEESGGGRGRGQDDRGRGHEDRGRGQDDRGRGQEDRGRGQEDRGRGQEDRAAKYTAYIKRYLPQPSNEGELSKRSNERCEQRREEVKKKLSNNNSVKNNNNNNVTRAEDAKPKPLMDVVMKRNHRAELESHLDQSPVPYKIATMGSARRLSYMASVVVEGQQYKTYPQTFNSQQEAEDALAAMVLEKLGVGKAGTGTGQEKEPPVTRDILTCAQRVLELLDQRTNGVWSSQVESEYLKARGERLPPTWLEQLVELGLVRTHNPLADSQRCVVFANCSEVLPNLPPLPRLPDDDIWEVLVTTIRSVSMVTVRLLGDAWSARLDALLGDMDLHYFQDSGPAPELTVGGVYAAQAASEWHRVRLEEVTEEDCLCMFLDHGDTDRVAKQDLRQLQPEFLLLPPQALTVEVAGLEDFQDRVAVLPTVNQLLLGKSLVARVEDRVGLGARLQQAVTPRLIFFDTSSQEEDVNINQKLIEMIVSEDAKSKLPAVGAEEIRVHVTSITDKGDLYVTKVTDVVNESTVPNEEDQEGDLTSLPLETPETKRLHCRLAGVPPEGHSWSPAATEALRDLVSQEEVVSLRVLSHTQDGCPEVELHLLEDSHGSINFDLSTEFDIFPPCTASLETTSPEPPVSLSPAPASLPPPVTSSPGPCSLPPLVPLPPASLPAPGSLLDLRVTHAVSPDSFVVRLCGEQLDLAEQLQQHYSSSSGDCADVTLASGDSYYALKSGDSWHRVEVTQVVGAGQDSQAVVRYVDEGGQAVVGARELRVLGEEFRSLPCQALAASLACLQPVEGDWTPEDNFWFNQRVAGRQLVGLVHGVEPRLLLELRDPRDNTAVHRQLVQEGKAVLR